jgi:acetoacetyl-CoA synthetase
LRRRDDAVALVGILESGERHELSYRALYFRVARLAAALRRDGVEPGDRVVGYLPNVIDTVVAMLAATSIGAVWSSCSPDFGSDGLLDRFGQIEPQILFTADGYTYNGVKHDSLARVTTVVSQLTSIRRVIVIPMLQEQPNVAAIPTAVLLDDYCDQSELECEFAQLSFDHPLFILYSSGTTGKPKCIVHCAGGVLLEHQKEHLLHTDLGPKDIFFYYTTCGWMMWNWLISALACGSTLVLYDGSPAYPQADSLLQLVEQEGITVFGTSARYLSNLEKTGARPGLRYNLGSLQTILSTGSPLAAESFSYVYTHIRQDVLLSSIAGGTDLLGCFVSGNPCLPVYAGELQCKGLGMDVDVVADNGASLAHGKGELVCRQSFPSVPIGFWNDPDNRQFHAAYFARLPNVWAHGDYAEITEHAGLIIHGRSDAVLNPGGVRIGTAEIYRQVEKLPAILDSVVVAQQWDADSRIILFVRLQDGMELTHALEADIRQTIRANTTPRHVPARIIHVADIPHTRTGKVAELAVRKVIHGEVVSNAEALANPASLELYRDLPALRT